MKFAAELSAFCDELRSTFQTDGSLKQDEPSGVQLDGLPLASTATTFELSPVFDR